jgi:alpha-tubulin suppressor-like RCC1 family protein
MRRALFAAFAIACGARTELDVPTQSDGSANKDAIVVDVNGSDVHLDAAVDATEDVDDDVMMDVAPDEPDVVTLEKPVPAIAAYAFGCALDADGGVKCWQQQSSAQSVSGFPTPVVVLAVGGGHGFARLQDHTLWAWGSGQHCVLGTGVVNDTQASPVAITSLGNDVVAIATSNFQASAVLTDGSVVAWGAGPNGWGKTGDACAPTNVIGLNGPASSVAQGDGLGCALLVDGTIQCWGRNDLGQLGNKTTLDSLSASSSVSGISDATAIAASTTHACAVHATGNVSCWGDDTYGQLGDGQTNTTSNVPVDVTGLGGSVAQIATAENTTCTRLTSGVVQCWGSNGSVDALGNGGSPSTQATPADLFDGGVLSIGQQLSYGCGLLTNGGARCWGDYNKFTDAGSKVPVDVQGMP